MSSRVSHSSVCSATRCCALMEKVRVQQLFSEQQKRAGDGGDGEQRPRSGDVNVCRPSQPAAASAVAVTLLGRTQRVAAAIARGRRWRQRAPWASVARSRSARSPVRTCRETCFVRSRCARSTTPARSSGRLFSLAFTSMLQPLSVQLAMQRLLLPMPRPTFRSPPLGPNATWHGACLHRAGLPAGCTERGHGLLCAGGQGGGRTRQVRPGASIHVPRRHDGRTSAGNLPFAAITAATCAWEIACGADACVSACVRSAAIVGKVVAVLKQLVLK